MIFRRWSTSCFRHAGISLLRGDSSPARSRWASRRRKSPPTRAPAYPRVLDEYLPAALHTVEQYANNPIEADHGRLKAWLRPMRGLKRFQPAQTLAAGHAFVQNTRRGHYEIATDEPAHHRLRIAFTELVLCAWLAILARSCRPRSADAQCRPTYRLSRYPQPSVRRLSGGRRAAVAGRVRRLR
jgi:hypothetical protein